MTQFIQPDVETDPTELLQRAYAYLQANITGWTPNVPNLDVWILQAVVSAVAEARDVASSVPVSIFRYYGSLVGIPPIDAVEAGVQFKFTAVDNAGYTIPGGTQVGVYIDGVNTWPFQTLADAVIPAGSTTVDNVQAVAMRAGAAGSALGGVLTTAQMIDPLAFISLVQTDGPSSGGVDAESDSVYLSRLVAELQLLTPRPILPNDFAVLARNVAGVHRAAGIDGYDPGTNSYNNQREVTVAVVDANGAALSSGVKAAVLAYLQALREVNFIVNIVDPNINGMQVVYTAQSIAGADKVALKASIDAALKGYLSPATWGSVTGDALRWDVTKTLVRYGKVSQVIDNVPGVDYHTSLSIGPVPGALSTVDVSMTGPAPLPQLLQANISGTVL